MDAGRVWFYLHGKLELFVIIYEDSNYIISKFTGIVWLNDF